MARYLTSTDLIRFEVADRVARITLDRPEKRNALSLRMINELRDALFEADALTDVNVIVLAGEGKDFCAGFDLTTTYATSDPAEDGRYRSRNATLDDDSWHVEEIQRGILTIGRIHKPVIARLHGNCLAAGTDLAFSCDMVIAADDARIGFPAARANGTPPISMWLYHVGPQWAKRLLMTGDTILGRDAARIGLVLEAVAPEALDGAVDELARRMSFVDAELLAAHKRVIDMGLELMGAATLQRFAAETDARAHLAQGPRRTQFRHDMATQGLKVALDNRDAPFGDGIIRLRGEAT